MSGGGIVASINGGHNDHKVLDIAADEASRLHAGLTLLYVIVVGWDRGLNQSDDAALRECDKTIENAEGYLKKHDSRTSSESTVVQARSAGGAIVEHARQNDADLVVIGTRRYLGHDSLELGPTASHVLKNAPCRVVACYDPLV